MPTLEITPTERLEAMKEYIRNAEDKAAAREFVLSLLDPETDAALLDYLAESPE